MAGVTLLKILGAIVRWIFFGFTVSLDVLINDNDEQEHRFFSKNFIIGLVAFFVMMALIVY